MEDESESKNDDDGLYAFFSSFAFSFPVSLGFVSSSSPCSSLRAPRGAAADLSNLAFDCWKSKSVVGTLISF